MMDAVGEFLKKNVVFLAQVRNLGCEIRVMEQLAKGLRARGASDEALGNALENVRIGPFEL